jgi:hypothetical protein
MHQEQRASKLVRKRLCSIQRYSNGPGKIDTEKNCFEFRLAGSEPQQGTVQ